MIARQFGSGIILGVMGGLVALAGGWIYGSCTAVGGGPASVGGGNAANPSGCGAVLFMVGVGVVLGLLGALVAARAARTTRFDAGPASRTVPPPIFDPDPRPPADPATVLCAYCGTPARRGVSRCPSCGARL
jgi:hypothetical protein